MTETWPTAGKTVGTSGHTTDHNTLRTAGVNVDNRVAALEALLVLNAQTGTTYTFVLADANCTVTCSNASAVTVTIPPNASVAFPTGTALNVVNVGAGKVTLAPGSGVTISSENSYRALNQYNGATALKTGTNTWVLIGGLVA